MFRYLSLLFLAVFLLDLAASAIETRRVWVMGDIVLERKINPIGYWLMTGLWSLVALGCAAGVPYLTYLAWTASGPYREHDFLSMYQAWPYAMTSLVYGWLAFKIVRRRLFFLRHRHDAA
jgi:hypothetical protein